MDIFGIALLSGFWSLIHAEERGRDAYCCKREAIKGNVMQQAHLLVGYNWYDLFIDMIWASESIEFLSCVYYCIFSVVFENSIHPDSRRCMFNLAFDDFFL